MNNRALVTDSFVNSLNQILSWKLFNHPFMQVVSHMMPDLPNIGLERDIEQFIVSKLPFLQRNTVLQHNYFMFFILLICDVFIAGIL